MYATPSRACPSQAGHAYGARPSGGHSVENPRSERRRVRRDSTPSGQSDHFTAPPFLHLVLTVLPAILCWLCRSYILVAQTTSICRGGLRVRTGIMQLRQQQQLSVSCVGVASVCGSPDDSIICVVSSERLEHSFDSHTPGGLCLGACSSNSSSGNNSIHRGILQACCRSHQDKSTIDGAAWTSRFLPAMRHNHAYRLVLSGLVSVFYHSVPSQQSQAVDSIISYGRRTWTVSPTLGHLLS